MKTLKLEKLYFDITKETRQPILVFDLYTYEDNTRGEKIVIIPYHPDCYFEDYINIILKKEESVCIEMNKKKREKAFRRCKEIIDSVWKIENVEVNYNDDDRTNESNQESN